MGADVLHKTASDLEQSLKLANTVQAEKLFIPFILALEEIMHQLEKLAAVETTIPKDNVVTELDAEAAIIVLNQLMQYLKTGELTVEQSVAQLETLLAGHGQYASIMIRLSEAVDDIEYEYAMEFAKQLSSLLIQKINKRND